MPLRFIPAIHRATHRIGLSLADLREDGFSQGEAHILAQLAEHSPATVGELHRGLSHRRSTLTSILDRLEKRGLVTRAIGPADRRTFVVTLTADGRKAARRVYDHLAELERRIAAQLTQAESRALEKALDVVATAARRERT
jgi:DNA-binding MarR family transcriptional regulator